jgi:large subunit ribosomal protein L23
MSTDKFQIIKRPLVTEKAIQSAEESNIYIFRVDPSANKVQIKKAVEEIYDVKVLAVKTASFKGKPKTYRRYYHSRGPDWKKAYVTLSESDYINLI